MKIALYNHHHNLPFWHHPTQPISLFDEEKMSSYTGKDNKKVLNAEECDMWPILVGLKRLMLYDIMAHVSVIFDNELKTFDYPKRVWVQITTVPFANKDCNLPIITDGGKVNVICLWGLDNKTYHPHQLLDKGTDHSGILLSDPMFWANFFRKKIMDEKNRVEQSLRDTEIRVLEIKNFLKKYPNL